MNNVVSLAKRRRRETTSLATLTCPANVVDIDHQKKWRRRMEEMDWQIFRNSLEPVKLVWEGDQLSIFYALGEKTDKKLLERLKTEIGLFKTVFNFPSVRLNCETALKVLGVETIEWFPEPKVCCSESREPAFGVHFKVSPGYGARYELHPNGDWMPPDSIFDSYVC